MQKINQYLIKLVVPFVLFGTAMNSAWANQTDQPKNPTDKVYEMRTYHTHDGKLDALHARFRDHTHRIFNRLGMSVVAYWTPTDDVNSDNTLIYIIEHDSEQDAKHKWKNFIADEEWKKAYKASRKNGALVKSIDVVFMRKTDFSPYLRLGVQ